jgi:hypothetical protein
MVPTLSGRWVALEPLAEAHRGGGCSRDSVVFSIVAAEGPRVRRSLEQRIGAG